MLFPDPWGLLRRELWPRIIASYSSQAMHSLAVLLALPHRVWTLYGIPGGPWVLAPHTAVEQADDSPIGHRRVLIHGADVDQLESGR